MIHGRETIGCGWVNMPAVQPSLRAQGSAVQVLAAVSAFVRLGRPLFLVGGAVLYALGVAVARAQGHGVDLRRYLLGQAVVICFQLMTHYANDYFDYEADRLNRTPTRWSGGSRVLPDGGLPRVVALVTALVLAALGILAIAALAVAPPLQGVAIPVGMVMFALSWLYSGPPLRLHSAGLGELDVALVVTGLVPVMAYGLQATGFAGAGVLLLALLPLALLQMAMMLAVEFPDAESDAQAGKHNLVVRLGRERGGRLYIALTAVAYLTLPLAVAAGLPSAIAWAASAPLPLAAWRIWRVWRGDNRDPRRFESVAFWAVALLVATAVTETLAFLFLRGP
jgi:1,4-dihydroxy-2-naphthoate polyprenyltransferase